MEEIPTHIMYSHRDSREPGKFSLVLQQAIPNIQSGQPHRSGGHSLLMTTTETCSSPRRAIRSHSLVCSENYLLIVGIGPILNKELELIF